MAKLKITRDFLSLTLFGYSENEVEILDVQEKGDFGIEWFEFDINGKDIPDCEEIECRLNLQTNQAGQVFTTMKFLKIK